MREHDLQRLLKSASFRSFLAETRKEHSSPSNKQKKVPPKRAAQFFANYTIAAVMMAIL